MGMIESCVSVLGDVLPKLGEGVRAWRYKNLENEFQDCFHIA